MKHLKTVDYKVSSWSGGTTTQIYIYPEDCEYSNLDFQFRISSATIETNVSNFTNLPDYNRFITTLDNNIEINHGMDNIQLNKCQVYEFDGGLNTMSYGICKDFNLMINKQISGSLVYYENPQEINVEKEDVVVVYVLEGDIWFDDVHVKQNESVVFKNRDKDILLNSVSCKILVSKINLKGRAND